MDTLTPGSLISAVRGLVAPTITLPIPHHALTINGRLHRHAREELMAAHQASARIVAEQTIPAALRPWFDPGDRLIVTVRVERLKRGNRWDFGGLVEALKSYLDGLEGTYYVDDKIIGAARVHWDTRPTGAGLVHMTFALDADAED